MSNNYTDVNSQVIDGWIENQWEWGIPITHETFMNAKQHKWDVVLTPTKPVPKKWFPKLEGCKILGLASGGGQQMPIFAALGAECTVMDYSQKQLASERIVAEREGYNIKIVRADMTKPFPFGDEEFDLIFHPVSNCYVEDIYPIWRECFRVLKKGGILMSGLDNGMNFIIDDDQKTIANKLPFNPLKDNDLYKKSVEDDWGIQFSHTLEEQIGGQLKAGFILNDLYEDINADGLLHEYNIPTFWATRAVKG